MPVNVNSSVNPATIAIPVNPARTFGIELEVGIPGMTAEQIRSVIQSELQNSGIRGFGVVIAGYTHQGDGNRNFVLKYDSSLVFERGITAIEIVSPVLQGENGYRAIRALTMALARMNVKVNKTCGFHLHIGTGDFGLTDYKTLLTRYLRAERRIYSMLSPSRFYGDYSVPLFRQFGRNGNFAGNADAIENACAEIWQRDSLQSIYRAFFGTRYLGLNIEPVSQGTRSAVEIRSHQATADFAKIIAWAEFWLAFVSNCKGAENRYRARSANYGNRRAYIANCVLGTSTRPARYAITCWQFLSNRRETLKTTHRESAMQPRNRNIMRMAGIQWNAGYHTWEPIEESLQAFHGRVRRDSNLDAEDMANI